MSNVIPFPTRTSAKPGGVPYPVSLQVVCDNRAGIDIDPSDMIYECFEADVVEAGPPRVFVEGEAVVLDLGDCLPDHTTLKLDPKAAYEWARALIYAARAAKEIGTPCD